MKDILYHFRFYVFLAKGEDQKGPIHRRIMSLYYINENGESDYIYRWSKNGHNYRKISQNIAEMLNFDESNHLFIKTFIKENHYE